jgi:hypothetical protein
MLNHLTFASLLSCCFVACSEAPSIDPPNEVPIDPSGHYIITSSYALSATPPAASGMLAELVAATDGPDDPSRYLIDLMIDRINDGATRTYLTALAPYLAAYVNDHLAEVAPRFADGARDLASGLSRIALRFGTAETFAIDGASLRRTITGFRFDLHAGRDVAEVRFAPLGLPDLTAASQVAINRETLTIDRHAVALPYTQLLRLGFDLAVIPDVVPDAHDLAQALAELVDCDAFGTSVATWLDFGSPSVYATACRLGLSALATRIYDQIATIDAASLTLELAGTAWAIDDDGDGPMDVIEMGTWIGNFAGIAVTSSFEGSRP